MSATKITNAAFRAIAFAGLTGALASAAAPAQTPEQFTLTGDAALFNVAGSVRIERGTSGDVVVELTRGGSDASRLTIETGSLEGWQTLRVIYPDDNIVYPRMSGRSRTQFEIADNGTFGSSWSDTDDVSLRRLLRMAFGERNTVTVRGSGTGLEAYADVRVLVPVGRRVAVHLGVGEIVAANVDGNLVVDARSAPITASGLRGTVRLATGSGRIELDGAEGNVSLDTGSGDIRVAQVTGDRLSIDTGSGAVRASEVRSESLSIDTGSGSVDVLGVVAEMIGIDTGSGSIRVDDAQASDLSLDTGSGSITVDLRTNPRSTNIDTGSGTVTLTVPPELGATLDLSSGSGGISTDMPVRIIQQKRSMLRGTIGDGSARISVETGSGSIRIRSR
ncbi:MAG: DUF4097 family beta strand repeat-containing protein [Longimicrobiales bacterium]